MNANVVHLKGLKEVPPSTPKSVRSQMDTLLLTQEGVRAIKIPPFQRPLKINAKVQALTQELKDNGGVLPGVLTIGVLRHEKYVIDGQHRIEAFKLSEIKEGYADVRICHFDEMGEMGEEFVKLNSSLVKLNPDDILRGIESSHDGIALIRKECPFIGYDQIRRGERSPLVSMSIAIRAWFISEPEAPTSGVGGIHSVIERLNDDEAERMADFYKLVFESWGRDYEYRRLWMSLNLTMCAWYYRRTVLAQYSPATIRLNKSQFGKCLMSLSAKEQYVDWLMGRQLAERDRAPCFNRIKEIFTARLREEFPGKHIRLPGPAWAHGGSHKR